MFPFTLNNVNETFQLLLTRKRHSLFAYYEQTQLNEPKQNNYFEPSVPKLNGLIHEFYMYFTKYNFLV